MVQDGTWREGGGDMWDGDGSEWEEWEEVLDG